jgi:hypothetical protein
MIRSGLFILVVSFLVGLISCKSEYNDYVEREMSKGIFLDSTIFNLKIGEIRDTFFKKCYDLNKQKVIREGAGAEVRYSVPLRPGEDSIKKKELLFYGIFREDKVMVGMTMRYTYNAWAPWNENLQSDDLLEDVKDMIIEGYGGNEFIEVNIEGIKSKVLVKIDGNRRFLMYVEDPRYIRVKIEDLNHILKKGSK